MNALVSPGGLSGTIRAIPSKSEAHRALICAALSDGPTRIICPASSEDIDATIGCLE
ncbi:MAG: 3-phosphoshikimate 1-carboxyvinyltransferase, partial [Atopobiaceae bacterium]|nr:3-phosphoshikimate 1-carboxyvinyltransferase [Atopobiaceae bacterium]